MSKIVKYIPYIWILWLIVLFKPSEYVIFWEWAFYLLILVMYIRPLRDIFPKVKIFQKLTLYRKEFWILVWVFWLTHVIWYFLDTKLWLDIVFNPNIWTIDNYMAWGFIALFVSIPLTITSNKFSMIKLWWKNWKRLQYLSYIMFFSVLFHMALVNQWKVTQSVIIWWLYILIYIIAYYKNNLKFKKS